jgi:biopolymer transport protein ExbB
MNTVNLREASSRQHAPAKFLAATFAALFLAFAPAALAQEPDPATPPAETTEGAVEEGAIDATGGVDTSIPGLSEVAPVEEAPAVAAEAVEAEGEEEEGGVEAFSIQSLWTEGDIVAKITLILMILMSIGSWYIVITKFLDQNRLFGNAKKLGDFWEASSVDDGINQLGSKNAFRDIADSAVQAAQSGDSGLMGRISRTNRMSHRVVQSVEGINNRLSGGMAFLATVGAISPFVGLFGTVYGIVNALIAIGISGQASIDKVAGPVGEALYMTAIGLFVAVPAVIFYNLLGRRNKTLQDTARHFAVDVEQLLTAPTTKV